MRIFKTTFRYEGEELVLGGVIEAVTERFSSETELQEVKLTINPTALSLNLKPLTFSLSTAPEKKTFLPSRFRTS